MIRTLPLRQRQFALTSAAGLALTAIVLLLANVVGNWVYLRIDLTHANAYSLSASSRKLVRGLDDPVIIKAYFSEELPSPYNTYARYVKDLLTEYRNASRGRVKFQFVPPTPAMEFESKANTAGLAPLQFEQRGSDQLQIRRGYMGLVLFYRDRTETIPVIRDLANFEYDVTSRIARMARKEKKVIALTTGHGETNWRTGDVKLAHDLSAFYDLDHPVELPGTSTGPIKADVLLVVGPTRNFDEKSLWVIDQTIMSGVPTAFLVDSQRFLIQQFMMMPNPTGIDGLLAHYGVTLTGQLVLDPQCETVGMTQNLGGMSLTTSVRYPYVPLVTHFEKDHPILRGVETLGLPFPSRLETSTQTPKSVTFIPLFFSTNQSWLAPPNTYSVAPNTIAPPKPDEPRGPFILGGILEGHFPSYFAGRTAPVKSPNPLTQSPKTSIFVLGTSHVLSTQLPEFRGTDALITNMLAYLAKDDILIGIQAKGEILRPLRRVSPLTQDVVKILCLFGVPLLPVAWGLLRWRRRSAWRRTISAGFAK